jgi:hypothetical protein
VVTAPSSSYPLFERFKLLDSSANISKNGVANATGLAQFRKNLALNGPIWSGVSGGGALVSNQTTVGSGVDAWPHEMNNSAGNNAAAEWMIQFPIPLGTCTAHPINISIIYEIKYGNTVPALGANTMNLAVVGLEVVGNSVADPSGAIGPSARTLANTETVITKAPQVTPSPVDLNSGAAGRALVIDKLHSAELYSVDVSDCYEGDILALQLSLDSKDADSIVLWSLVVEGVSHQDGKGI